MKKPLYLMCQWTVLVKFVPSSTGSREAKRHLHMQNIQTCKYSHILQINFFLTQYCRIWKHVRMCNLVTWYSATYILNSSEQQKQIIRVLFNIIFRKQLIQIDISTCNHTVFRSLTQGLHFSQISVDWFLHYVNYLL